MKQIKIRPDTKQAKQIKEYMEIHKDTVVSKALLNLVPRHLIILKAHRQLVDKYDELVELVDLFLQDDEERGHSLYIHEKYTESCKEKLIDIRKHLGISIPEPGQE